MKPGKVLRNGTLHGITVDNDYKARRVYKNTVEIKSIVLFLFSLFAVIILLMNIVDGIKSNNFVNIRYYTIVLIPLIYVTVFLSINHVYCVVLYENRISIKKLMPRKIYFYEILEINEPNVISLEYNVKLFPEKDSIFWNELNIAYSEYKERNIEYFDKTIDDYKTLLEISEELNIEKDARNVRIHPHWSLLAVFFIWFFYLSNYLQKRETYKEYNEYRDKLKEIIGEYKSRPGFA